MTAGSKRLIEFGFTSKDGKDKWADLSSDDKTKAAAAKEKLKKAGPDDVEKDADHHELEVAKDQILTLDWPKPEKSYYVVYEAANNPIEPIYYWALGQMQHDLGFPIVDKIKDIFAASEQSSFYGAAGQRLSLAQDKVSTFLATIGQLIKRDLFQLVRDLRWLDERIKIHDDARLPKNYEPAETALKGIWVDLVDGVVQGQRVSQNIFGLAQQLNFTTLPTLFFNTHIRADPKSPEDLEKAIKEQVGRVSPNREVLTLLYRKMKEYHTWREANYSELKQRKRFELHYLRQHYNIIKMYTNWLKPYLRQIERMTMETSKLTGPELITAFEGNLIEIEILGRKLPDKNKNCYACMLLTFEYRTRPSLQFQVEAGFHRGPIHVGEAKLTWRAYGWDDKTIQRYKQMREREDLEQLAKADTTIMETMDAIGDDLKKYLEEAEGLVKPKTEEKKEAAKGDVLEPFKALGRGFKELFIEPFFPTLKKGPSSADKSKEKKEQDDAKSLAKKMLWTHYKLFKKAHGMYGW